MEKTILAENSDNIKGIKRQTCEIWSRVVGYLRPVSGWNKGKKAEKSDRKNYVTLEV